RAPDVGGAAVELDRALDGRLGRLRGQRPAGVEAHAAAQREGPGLPAVGRGPVGGQQRVDLVGGGVVPGQRLVHLAHGDDAVGVLGGRVPAVVHDRGGGVVGEDLARGRRVLGAVAAAAGGGQQGDGDQRGGG